MAEAEAARAATSKTRPQPRRRASLPSRRRRPRLGRRASLLSRRRRLRLRQRAAAAQQKVTAEADTARIAAEQKGGRGRAEESGRSRCGACQAAARPPLKKKAEEAAAAKEAKAVAEKEEKAAADDEAKAYVDEKPKSRPSRRSQAPPKPSRSEGGRGTAEKPGTSEPVKQDKLAVGVLAPAGSVAMTTIDASAASIPAGDSGG